MAMNRIYTLLVLSALLLVSCGPSRYAVQVEMRYPSKSGLELAGKIVSVVYLTDGDAEIDGFDASMADGFAYSLENDYGTGEGSVGVYSIEDKGGQYSHKDTLVNLLMDTGSDVVFLFDRTEISRVGADMLKFSLKLYCFDAMNTAENVYSFTGSSMFEAKGGELQKEGWEAGCTVAVSFKSQWKHEQYSIVYYDSEKWYDALEKAESYEWKDAMDIWMTFLDTNDPLKRSSAEYNIAVACYMLGDYALAKEWLELSDNDNRLPLSDALHKRIDSRRK